MTSVKARAGALVVLALLLAGCEIGTAPPDAAPQTAKQRATPPKLAFIDGYQQGLSEAAQQGKPLLVFFTATWCDYCHQMADEALLDPKVVRLGRQFVCVRVDADAEQHVCRELQVPAYPTLLFLSPRGVPLERVVGKRAGHEVLMAMQAALQHVARRNDSSDIQRQ
jgi:thiol:disulfide interchange protein